MTWLQGASGSIHSSKDSQDRKNKNVGVKIIPPHQAGSFFKCIFASSSSCDFGILGAELKEKRKGSQTHSDIYLSCIQGVFASRCQHTVVLNNLFLDYLSSHAFIVSSLMSQSGLGPTPKQPSQNPMRTWSRKNEIVYFFFAIVLSHPESCHCYFFFLAQKSEHHFLLSSSIPVSTLTLHYPTHHAPRCPLLTGKGLVCRTM